MFPFIFSETIEKAVSADAPRATVETMMKIRIYAGIVTGPVVAALIGAVITALAA